MTWLSTWLAYNRPHYAVHPSEQQAIEHVKTLKAAGYPAVEFEMEEAS